jgi:hypothetical protein
MEDGSVAGRVTSAAELKLPAGRRGFALAMMKTAAEKPGLTFTYSVNSDHGTAQILTTPPNFKSKA